jgi:putative transposase
MGDKIGEKRRENGSVPKRATNVVLSEQEREELTRMTKRHKSEQQQVVRAQIILLASKGYSNTKIAAELSIDIETVRKWRDRWVRLQGIDLKTVTIAQRLEDAQRPGKPSKITEEQRCQMAVLACEAPSQAQRPISQWTGREIADEMKARGIIEKISPRHAARLLKKKG